MQPIKENWGCIRSSTDDQELTIEFQQLSMLNKAKELGVVLKEENILVDKGISGFSTNYEQRPGIAELIKKVKNGQVKRVFLYRRDRLSRRAREYLYLVFTMHKYGVEIIFTDVTEVPFTPEYGWIIECTLAAVIQREVENIRHKVTLGLQTLFKNGHWSGGCPPFGLIYEQ